MKEVSDGHGTAEGQVKLWCGGFSHRDSAGLDRRKALQRGLDPSRGRIVRQGNVIRAIGEDVGTAGARDSQQALGDGRSGDLSHPQAGRSNNLEISRYGRFGVSLIHGCHRSHGDFSGPDAIEFLKSSLNRGRRCRCVMGIRQRSVVGSIGQHVGTALDSTNREAVGGCVETRRSARRRR